MSSRVEKALENHGKGYNCCQAVACAYADLVGVDENLIFAAGEGFGAGMGGMQCTCGAVSGACMVAGLLKSSRNTKEPVTKGATYRVSREIVQKFGEKNGSVVCKDLKGIGTGKVLRSCDGCIKDAAQILEQVMDIKTIEESREFPTEDAAIEQI